MTPKSVKPCRRRVGQRQPVEGRRRVTCVAKAFTMMTQGSDVLDALVAGVTIVELDPNQTGVGWSGLPNADGVVQLDACCMHGPKKRAGGVAANRGVRSAGQSRAARRRTRPTTTCWSARARRTSRARWAFKIEDGLINENAREHWLEWKRRTDPLHYLDPEEARAGVVRRRRCRWSREGLIDAEHYLGHDQLRRRQRQGRDLRCDHDERSGVEDPGPRGRLPDSRRRTLRRRRGRRRRIDRPRRSEPLQPLVVPHRGGDAARRASEGCGHDRTPRVQKNTIEKRLLNSRGLPNFGLSFYMLNAKGSTPASSICNESKLRRLHRERPADAQDGRAVRRQPPRTSINQSAALARNAELAAHLTGDRSGVSRPTVQPQRERERSGPHGPSPTQAGGQPVTPWGELVIQQAAGSP